MSDKKNFTRLRESLKRKFKIMLRKKRGLKTSNQNLRSIIAQLQRLFRKLRDIGRRIKKLAVVKVQLGMNMSHRMIMRNKSMKNQKIITVMFIIANLEEDIVKMTHHLLILHCKRDASGVTIMMMTTLRFRS